MCGVATTKKQQLVPYWRQELALAHSLPAAAARSLRMAIVERAAREGRGTQPVPRFGSRAVCTT